MNKVLVANRGEIARRIFRTCRQMGLATVAIYSEPDRGAPFVAEADEAVALGGSTPAESYLKIDAIVEAARRTGADAVHPGYGFLSENAGFAEACVGAGLTFVGPPPAAIAAMGSKIEAKRRMQAAGVPLLPGLEVAAQSAGQLLAEVQKQQLDWPLLIKASAGGGGRGMRIVRGPEELADALSAAGKEAQSAFGDATVFIEPYVEGARHVELQIFGDTAGNVVHLFERECSIQRRHQKILEESPSVALDDALRGAMGAAAVAAGRAIGYANAGTVEFLVTPDRKFYFLEVNTRLQVEHPVTECLTGLDLVRLQLEVAQGRPLPPEALSPRREGHAIEVRLYAEDPRKDFLPVTGRLARFRIPEGPGLRVDTGFVDGSEVSPFYDAMLAKVIVHAATREEAARRLASALRGAEIHGLRTNRELLVRLLEHPEFLAGKTDTHFLNRHDPAELARPLADAKAEGWHAAAAALAAQAERRATAVALRSLPSGWRNSASQKQQVQYEGEHGPRVVGYLFHRDRLELEVNGQDAGAVRLTSAMPSKVRLEVEGVARTYRVHRADEQVFVDSPLGSSTLREVPRFPQTDDEAERGSLVAPLPGVVVEVKVVAGQQVVVGDTLVIIESMKMLHPVTAPVAGQVGEVRVTVQSHVEAGAVLAVIQGENAE